MIKTMAKPARPTLARDQAALERGVTAAPGTTKARIERAALLLFCARGIDAVTTREIAAASGISEGALYRHYKGKDALSQTMFFTIHDRLAAEVQNAARQSTTLEEQARAIVAAYCRIADEDWALFSYHLLTTHRFLPRTDKSTNKSEKDNPVSIIEGVITAAMERREIPAGDSALKAASALGVVLQAALHKAYGRVQGTLSNHQDTLSRGVIAVLHS